MAKRRKHSARHKSRSSRARHWRFEQAKPRLPDEHNTRAEPKPRRTRWFARVTWTAASLGAIGAAVVLTLLLTGHWDGSATSRVAADLTQVGPASFTPTAQPDGGMSPVCGCLESKINEWRGVTFAGREVTLRRSGKAPITEWLASGASLNPIELANDETRMTVETFGFDGTRFSPSWLNGGLATLRQHAQNVGGKTRFYAHTLKVITEGSLHVDMTGPVPVGDWIPLPESTVTLKTVEGPFSEEAPPIQLQERYPHLIGLQTNNKTISSQGYPLGDFLGPEVILWSNTEFPFSTEIFDQAGTRKMSRKLVEGMRPAAVMRIKDRVFVAIIRDSGFSTRLAAIPLEPYELDGLMENLATASTRQKQIDGFHWGGGDDGHVTLTVNHPLTPEGYARVRRHVEEIPEKPARYWRDMELIPPVHQPHGLKANYFEYDARGPDAPESGTGSHGELFRLTPSPAVGPDTSYDHGYVGVRDRYPPLPPNAGFNVFGPMKTLRIDAALGTLTVGGTQVAIDPAQTISLADLKDFQTANRQSVVSVPMKTGPGTAQLEFSAVGAVKVDGRTYAGTRLSTEARDVALQVLGVLAAVITLAGAALALFRGLSRRSRHDVAKR
jgi:hypothetical protein